MDDRSDRLSMSTRVVILVVGALGVAAGGAVAWSMWSVFALLADPFLWFLGVIALGAMAWAAGHLVVVVPSLLRFYRAFLAADPSSYYAGFVPAAALLAPAVALAVVGARPALWVPPAAIAFAIVGLLLLPATRRDFDQ